MTVKNRWKEKREIQCEQMTEGFAKLIIRICQSVNPKTVEEYVLHR